MTTPKVQAALDALLSALREEIKLDFLAVLGGGGQPDPLSVPKRGRGGKPAKLKARPKGAKRSADEIDELIGHTLKFIKSNPGSRSEQIAAGLGVSTKDLVLPITKLFESKAIKSTGQRRGTKYTAK